MQYSIFLPIHQLCLYGSVCWENIEGLASCAIWEVTHGGYNCVLFVWEKGLEKEPFLNHKFKPTCCAKSRQVLLALIRKCLIITAWDKSCGHQHNSPKQAQWGFISSSEESGHWVESTHIYLFMTVQDSTGPAAGGTAALGYSQAGNDTQIFEDTLS